MSCSPRGWRWCEKTRGDWERVSSCLLWSSPNKLRRGLTDHKLSPFVHLYSIKSLLWAPFPKSTILFHILRSDWTVCKSLFQKVSFHFRLPFLLWIVFIFIDKVFIFLIHIWSLFFKYWRITESHIEIYGWSRLAPPNSLHAATVNSS
jgi:hypothetical protein